MNIFKSLKAKIISMVTILLVVVCIGFAITSYITSSNALISNVEDILPNLAQQSANVVESRIKMELNALQVMAERESINDPHNSWKDKIRILNEEVQRSGHMKMGISDKDGNYRTTTGESFNIKDREHFQKAINGEDYVSDPILSKGDNSLIITFAVPIKEGNKITGVLTAVRDGNELSNMTNDITFGKTGNAFMINKSGTTIAHTNKELVHNQDNDFENVKSDPNLKTLVELEKKMVEGKAGVGSYEYGGTEKYMGYAPVKLTGWSLAITAPKSEVLSGLNTLLIYILIVTLIFIVLGILVTFMISSSIANPIKSSVEHLKIIASGDFTFKVPEKFLAMKDEIGVLAHSIDTMQNSMREVIKNVIDESTSVGTNVDLTNDSMSELTGHIEDVSATAEEMSASMEETAASTEEMNASSTEIGKAVESIAEKAQNGAVEANRINNKAGELRENFIKSQESAINIFNNVKVQLEKALEESKAVEQINVLADAILQITSQTNLLALNAAIEAARAGEAGKGFAVVADEIRELAENSKQTATQIQAITKTVVNSVDNLSENSNKMLEFMSTNVDVDYKTMLNSTEEYKKDAGFINDLVSDLSATTEELAASIENMVTALNDVTISNNESAEGTQNIAQKATAVVEKSNMVVGLSNNTKESTGKLINLVSKFKV